MSTYIIAEAGVNHNGSMELATELIRVASECGADAIKFQTFKTDKLVTKTAKKAKYQNENDDSSSTQEEMLRRLELSYAEFVQLSKECEKYNIDFLTTCFDRESLQIIYQEISPKTLKVGSGDLTNLPLLVAHARTQARVIISTGMATLSEVEDALAALAFGYLCHNKDAPPNYQWLKRHYYSEEKIAKIRDKVMILHCVTDYPAQSKDLNLDAIRQLREAYKIEVGYSDHSLGIEACCAAVALGAVCLEKHLTLDKSMSGPDHAASASPKEFRDFVRAIRNLDIALVPRLKAPTQRELGNLEVARKYLVASRDILSGEQLSADNVEIKRSEFGMSPVQYWDVIGQVAKRDYNAGENI